MIYFVKCLCKVKVNDINLIVVVERLVDLLYMGIYRHADSAWVGTRIVRKLFNYIYNSICEHNSSFFELILISKVSDRFNGLKSTSLVNLKKIGQGHHFAHHVTRSHRRPNTEQTLPILSESEQVLKIVIFSQCDQVT